MERNTYLLAWNPKSWNWPAHDLARMVSRVEAGEYAVDRWSLGGSTKPRPGDHFYLIKLGSNPRGIFAAGEIIGQPFWDARYDEPTRQTTYAMIRYSHLVDGRKTVTIPMEELKSAEILSRQHWSTQMSGISIQPEVAVRLSEIWSDRIGVVNGPSLGEELSGPVTFVEGHRMTVHVNRYERDARARRLCIEYHGTRCSACETDLTRIYGETAAGFTHVHHLKPLATIGSSYRIDPIKELRPVCPNCHAIIHLTNPALSIEGLKSLIAASRARAHK
jgi:5-methylcytosine-specific restriction protein A